MMFGLFLGKSAVQLYPSDFQNIALGILKKGSVYLQMS